MRETRSSGSVEGVLSDGHLYSDSRPSVRRYRPHHSHSTIAAPAIAAR